ncbi:MAG: hydroxymethylglutaryl-CoA synthase [Cutibacterium avidum]|nr:hydroxymethylglutaryl-CoA synthase [Cutibacterium avidum]
MTRTAGIEAMNFYGGSAYLDVTELARYRNLDNERFENLLMLQRSVPLPYEDPVSYGVNAAKPLIDAMSSAERSKIDMVITSTESGIDFGKSMSTYIHDQLGLSRRCRLFEVKNACYSGTAGFMTALSYVRSEMSPGAKALVVATDLARFNAANAGEALQSDWSFAEPSGGAGAIAMVVGLEPEILRVDPGAHGMHSYEVMDTCRPIPDSEAGDADLSLLSYLDCCENAYRDYASRVAGVDYQKTFDYLSFHTPFGGMVRGAHRTMMRRVAKVKVQADIDRDFETRVLPGIRYCQRVGNAMGATVYLNMLSAIVHADVSQARRLGLFSYGSGCSSEFYSGVFDHNSQEALARMNVGQRLDDRYRLSIDEYEMLLRTNNEVGFGTRNVDLDLDLIPGVRRVGGPHLVLKRIREFHREYEWVGA